MDGAFYTITNNRGLIFDAKTDFELESVTLFVSPSTTFTGTINLYDNMNTVIGTKGISLTQSGANIVELGFVVPKGADYRLMLNSPSGGQIQVDPFSNPFPVENNYLSIKSGTAPYNTHYSYFYDWNIRLRGSCTSQRSPATVTVLEAPEFDLGNDTSICDNSITFDITQSNPSTIYQWSTGDSVPVLTFNNINAIEVQVSIGNCTKYDTIEFDILTTPADPTGIDTVFCSPGERVLTVQGSADDYYWFDSPSSEIPIVVGKTINVDFQDSTSFYVEARNLSSIFTKSSSAGKDSVIEGSYFSISNTRGLILDAKKDCYIQSVTLYSEPTPLLTGQIVLKDNTGASIASKSFSATEVGAKTINLDFFIPQGDNYQLVLQNPTGGKLHVNFINPGFPIINPIVDIISGVAPYETHYSYFYDLKIKSHDFCPSNRIPVNIDVIFPVNIPDYLYTCDSVTIQTNSSTGSILWSNGETTPSILVDSSGFYSVIITDGANCTLYDTTEVEIATIGLPDDGILCGNTLTTNFDSTAVFLWSTGDTTPTLNITTPGTYSVFVDEPKGCQLRDTIVISGFDDFPIVDLGPDKSECISTELDAENIGLNHLWSTGDTTSSIIVEASGAYWVSVSNSNGCTTTDTIGVSITPIPTASFVPVVNGFNVSLVNQSDFGSWFWDFGDGESSTLSNPVHTYLDTGTFLIQFNCQ